MEVYAAVNMESNNITGANLISGSVLKGGQLQGPTTIVTAPGGANYQLSTADWGKIVLFPNVDYKVFLPTSASLSGSTGWNTTVFNNTNNTVVMETTSGGDFMNGIIQIYVMSPYSTANIRYIGGTNFILDFSTAYPVFSTPPVFIDFTVGGDFLTDEWFMGSSKFILTSANIMLTSVTGLVLPPLISINFAGGTPGDVMGGTAPPVGAGTNTMFICPINQVQPVQATAGSTLYFLDIGLLANATTYEGYVSLSGYIMPFI